MGSEMCIRDRLSGDAALQHVGAGCQPAHESREPVWHRRLPTCGYTAGSGMLRQNETHAPKTPTLIEGLRGAMSEKGGDPPPAR